MIKIIFHIFSLFYVCFDIIFCTDYYVKTTGSNSNNGVSYSTAFGTIDYVMTNIVNGKGGNNRVYVDKGTYNYGLSNFMVNITGYVEDSSDVSSSDSNMSISIFFEKYSYIKSYLKNKSIQSSSKSC
jgi:hypothetical protein